MHYDVKTLLHLKYFQICCSKVYHINTSFSTSCMRVSPVKWKSQNEWFSIKSRSHHTQSIRNKYIRKLLLGHNKILETKCFYITIKTHESTVSIIQLHNPAKLRKWKNKLSSPPLQPILVSPPIWNLHPALKQKNTQIPSKNFLRTKKSLYIMNGRIDNIWMDSDFHLPLSSDDKIPKHVLNKST